jgi:hypothetical protein
MSPTGTLSRSQRARVLTPEAMAAQDRERFISAVSRYLSAGTGRRLALERVVREAALKIDAGDITDLIHEAHRRIGR